VPVCTLYLNTKTRRATTTRRTENNKRRKKLKSKRTTINQTQRFSIDEAHCMSQWAHNFWPSFLRFKSLLRLLDPKSILAITATAGPRVIADISETLGIQVAVEENASNCLVENESIKMINKSQDNIDVACQFVQNHEERLSMVRRQPDCERCDGHRALTVVMLFFAGCKDSTTSTKEERTREAGLPICRESSRRFCDCVRLAPARYRSCG
jgi:hypothetical protein